MKYQITHKTVYTGTEPVSVCHNEAWLQPRALEYQQCEDFQLKIDPLPSSHLKRIDSFGNHVDLFSFNQGYQTLKVTATSSITVMPRSPVSELPMPWETVRDYTAKEPSPLSLQAYQFAFESPRVRTNSEFADYAKVSFRPNRDIREAGLELTSRIFDEFSFDNRATTVTTPVEQVFRTKKGVCQDFAHMQISMLRSLKLPVRYVSGYLRTYPAPGKERLIGADATHAWLSLYCGPEIGWLDLDPTNNTIANTDHITVAWGRDYGDVCPLKGVVIGGGKHSLNVSVDVKPVETPASIREAIVG